MVFDRGRYHRIEVAMESRDIAPMTRREWIAGIAAAAMAAPPDFERIDTHTHIHRTSPALLSSMEKAAGNV